MFKHILVPTDGSALSESATKHAIELAQQCGAKLTALHVVPKFHAFTYQINMLEATEEDFAANSTSQAEHYLEMAQSAARAAGVACDGLTATGDHPYQQIVEAAEQSGCDLIVMASHGRHGVEGMLLGSETHKVLTHTHVPVLVYH